MDESYRLKIEYVPLDKLKPYERNARKHGDTDIDAIAASIKRFGFKDPIGVWGKNVIVEGHGRLLAAKKLNLAEVPIIRLDDLTDEERRMYALAHNMLGVYYCALSGSIPFFGVSIISGRKLDLVFLVIPTNPHCDGS